MFLSLISDTVRPTLQSGAKGQVMQVSIRPYVTTGIAIVGASLIAVTPVAPPAPNVQQRALKLVDYTEYDASQLASTTEANWSGLETILSSSNWTTDPDISQGLSTLFSDLSTGTSNAVTNPLSELTEGALALFSSDYGFNAASTAFTAVTDNIESALSSGDYSTALTDFENEGTTVLYAFLNGYPDSIGSGLISPEFGLLTNTTDGAATGQIDALAQISNTIADEVANLGGANLTTGSLPLITGNLDLSVSISQILSDLGLNSGALTINGLLGDLGISPTSDILPNLNIGDVLGYLGLSDSSGLNLSTVLSDLGLTDTSSISIGDVLGDLGLTNSSGLSIDQILADLNLVTYDAATNTYSDPTISIDSILTGLGVNPDSDITIGSVLSALNIDPASTLSLDGILGDLGLNTTSSLSLDGILGDLGLTTSTSLSVAGILNDLGLDTTSSLSVGGILGDLGIDTSSTISIGSILGDLGINTSSSLSLDSLLSDVGLGGGISVSSLITELFGNPKYLGVSLSSILNSVGIGNDQISVASFLNAVGIGNSGISLNEVLSALGINGSYSINTILGDLGLNSGNYSISTILTDLGLGGNFTVGQVLGDLGLSGNFSISDILNDLGLSGNFSVSDILGVLGLNTDSGLSFDQALSDLGINGSYSLDSILSTLGLDPTSGIDIGSILSGLGLSDASSIDLNEIISALGISPTAGINIGDILGVLGLGDSSAIPLPSLSIDGILGDLGINPDENILTLLGIPDTLSLTPSIDLDGGAVATYADDLAKDLLAVLGSIEPASADLPSLLTTEPAVDLTNLLSGLLTGLDVPVSVSGNLSLDLTSVVAELVPSVF
jgi:hypothetical protein